MVGAGMKLMFGHQQLWVLQKNRFFGGGWKQEQVLLCPKISQQNEQWLGRVWKKEDEGGTKKMNDFFFGLELRSWCRVQ